MPVGDDVIVIGREGAALTIPDPELSRQHASVRSIEGGIVVADLGSTNGTFVDGTRIGAPVTLTRDATVRIGSSEIAVKIPEGRSNATLVSAGAGEHAAIPPEGASPPAAAKRRRPPRKVILLLLVLALGVAAAAAAAIVWAGGSDTSTHTLTTTLTTLPLGEPTAVQSSGILDGKPLGRVEVIFVRQLTPNPRPGGKPVQLTGNMLVLSPSGIIGFTVNGTLRLTQSGGEDVFIRGSASNGTGDYKGVKGSFTMTGGRANARAPQGRYQMNGTLEY